MKRLFLAVILCLALPNMANAASSGVLSVGVNRAELVSLRSAMSEVIVANPEIADVVVHSANKVSVIGKKIGSTNVRFFSKGGTLLKEVDVIVGYDMPNIRRTLKQYYPDMRLTVDTINNSIAVSGVVPDAQTANRIMQIVYEFVKENRIDTTTTAGDSGQADDRFPGVVNLLSLNSSQQVMLKVRIGELKRTAIKRLGVNIDALNSGEFAFSSGAGAANLVANPFSTLSGTLTKGATSLTAALRLLESDGLLKLLAEPTLTTISGEPANFLAGGEFPIVTPGSAGASNTVEFKKYGVSLSFIPYVLSGNRIRLVVEPELSELDTTRSTETPSLTTRKAKTTVELAGGESFMVAGLIRDQINSAVKEMPGVAEVPIISSLLRSTSYDREETELVIAVTPYIVDPVTHSDIRMPTDEYRTPSTMEMFFYGALGSLSGNSYKLSQKPVLEGPVGFMTD